MRTWTVRYKWASGTGVAERITPPIDMHGGHEGVVTLNTGANVKPTRTRQIRAAVGDLYRDRLHNPRFGWRINRRISTLPVGTPS